MTTSSHSVPPVQPPPTRKRRRGAIRPPGLSFADNFRGAGACGSGRISWWRLLTVLLPGVFPPSKARRARASKIGTGSRSAQPPDPTVCPPRIVRIPITGTEPGWLDAISRLIALGRASRAARAAAGQSEPPAHGLPT